MESNSVQQEINCWQISENLTGFVRDIFHQPGRLTLEHHKQAILIDKRARNVEQHMCPVVAGRNEVERGRMLRVIRHLAFSGMAPVG